MFYNDLLACRKRSLNSGKMNKNMQNFKFLLGSFCLSLLILFSCNDPSILGSELLEEDQFDLQFSDDFRIEASTVEGDPILAYNSGPLVVNFQLGRIDEPIFGEYNSTVFMEFELNADLKPEFGDGATLDSAVIILPFSGFNTYGGALGREFEVDLLRIQENISGFDSLSTNTEIATEFLETVTFTVDSSDVEVINHVTGELDTLDGHIRIAVPQALADEIFNAPNPDSTFSTDDNFQDFFSGIALRPTANTDGMIGTQLLTPNTINASMQFFHHNPSVDTSFYLFPVGTFSVKTVNFNHDYNGSVVGDFIEQGTTGGDSLLFLQSMEGTNIELEFTNLADFQDIVVNRAELVFSLDSIFGDDLESYPPIEQLELNQILEDGTSQRVDDLEFLFLTRDFAETFSLFGGTLDEETNTYRMNFSTHFQRMIDGDVINKLEIVPFSRINQATRSVIKGPGRSNGAMRLEVFYTAL